MRFPRLLAGFIGFALMVVEIASLRIVAPYIGVSVYTWTSVIGAVLLGITLGNAVGGELSDRRPSPALLGGSIASAGAAILLANYLVPVLGSGLARVAAPVWCKTVWFACVAFFPAAFTLSMIPPQIAKATVQDLTRAGRIFGSLGAASAVGSIIGTFATGYVLIAFLGTKALMDALAISLLILGSIIAHPVALWKHRVAGLVMLFLVGEVFLPKLCSVETQYYCIRVDRKTETNDPARYHYVLRLDHLVHSYVYPHQPDQVGYGYEQVYTNVIAMRFAREASFSSLFIGGGGYSLPRYLERFYPHADLNVAEIDPGVTEVNHRLMELSRTTRIKTFSQDARMYLAEQAPTSSFDLVFGDAFNDFSVPTHLTTLEFHRLLKTRMRPQGVYALNIIDDAEYGQFLAAMIRTLRGVWQYVYVAPNGSEIHSGRNTIILLASDEPIDLAAWQAASAPHEPDTPFDPDTHRRAITLVSEEKVDAFLRAHPTPALTDAFAPTERYLAPVFADAY